MSPLCTPCKRDSTISPDETEPSLSDGETCSRCGIDGDGEARQLARMGIGGDDGIVTFGPLDVALSAGIGLTYALGIVGTTIASVYAVTATDGAGVIAAVAFGLFVVGTAALVGLEARGR